MLNLRLTIHDGTSSTVYENDALRTDAARVGRAVSDLDIELDDVDLYIGGTFLGISDPDDIPTGTMYRARLQVLDESGAVVRTVIDGGIVSDDIQYEARGGVWVVTLVQQAAVDFWATMRRYWTSDLWTFGGGYNAEEGIAAVDGVPVECYVFSGTRYTLENRNFSPLPTLLDRIIDAVDELEARTTTFTRPDDLWQVGDAGSDVYIHIGHWRLITCIEQLTALAGWRTRITYTSFPGTDWTIEMRPTSWTRPEPDLSGRTIDDDVLRDDYVYERETVDNFGIASADGVRGMDLSDITSQDTDSTLIYPAVPPAWGTVAAGEWRANKPITEPGFSGIDSRITLGDPAEIQAALVELRVQNVPIQIDTVASGIAYGWPVLPEPVIESSQQVNLGDLNLPTRGDPFASPVPTSEGRLEDGEEDVCYVAELYDDAGTWRALYASNLDVNGQEPVNQSWMARAWANQEMRRATRAIVTVPVRSDLVTSLGDQDTGVSFRASGWVVVEESHDLNVDRRDLRLERPIASLSDPEVPSLPETTTVDIGGSPTDIFEYTWIPIGLEGEIKTYDGGAAGTRDYLILTWGRTPIRNAQEYRYRVEIPDESVDETVYGLSFCYELASLGNGGQSYSDLTCNVTPIALDGSEGETTSIDLSK